MMVHCRGLQVFLSSEFYCCLNFFSEDWKIILIGGGSAGLTDAVTVAGVDKNKILISFSDASYHLLEDRVIEDHSAETAVLSVMNSLLLESDAHKVSVMALLDLSAAFDTLDHSVLLERLERTYGLRAVSSVLHEWVYNFIPSPPQDLISTQGMLDTAFSSITNFALKSSPRDDDRIDQLHHFVTVAILSFFAATTGFVEYAGEPIDCWNYGDYSWKDYQKYVNTFCWTQTLYRYPNETDRSIMPYELNSLGAAVDPSAHADDTGKVNFLRWVSIIFVVQALMFKAPSLLWREFIAYSGSKIVKIVEMLQGALFAKPDEKQEMLEQVALFMEQWLRLHRKPHWFLKANVCPVVKKTLTYCMLCVGNDMSNYQSSLYLVVKAVFLLNNICQFLILSAFLQFNFLHFGTNTLQTFSYSNQHFYSATNRRFPSVALCHFQTVSKNGTSGNWVQCILTINIFLEKLFLIEWFWLLALFVVTIINFFVWCFRIMQTHAAIRFVSVYMKLMGVYNPPLEVPESCSVEQFVTEYLRSDGVFVLRILAVNTNEVIVAGLVEELWKRYLEFDKQPVDPGLKMEETTALNNDGETEEPVGA